MFCEAKAVRISWCELLQNSPRGHARGEILTSRVDRGVTESFDVKRTFATLELSLNAPDG